MRDSPSSAQPTPTKRLQSASTSSLKSVPQLNQHERCPSCDRHFGPKAYDRHVEWCRERKARIQLTPANQAAKERLQARIKYQVPALKKSPLTIVREKYSQKSPLLGRSDMDVKSGPNNAKVVQKGKSFTSVDKSDREEIPFSRSQARMERIGDYGQDIKETKLDNRSGLHAKRTVPTKKINSTNVNTNLQDLTVSSLKFNSKKLVTWRDTVPSGNGTSECKNLKKDVKLKKKLRTTDSELETTQFLNGSHNVNNRQCTKKKLPPVTPLPQLTKHVPFKNQVFGKAVTDKVLRESLENYYDKKPSKNKTLDSAVFHENTPKYKSKESKFGFKSDSSFESDPEEKLDTLIAKIISPTNISEIDKKSICCRDSIEQDTFYSGSESDTKNITNLNYKNIEETPCEPVNPQRTSNDDSKTQFDKEIAATLLWASKEDKDAQKREREAEAKQKFLKLQAKLQEQMNKSENDIEESKEEDNSKLLLKQELEKISQNTFEITTDSNNSIKARTYSVHAKSSQSNLNSEKEDQTNNMFKFVKKQKKRIKKKCRLCIRCLNKKIKSKLLFLHKRTQGVSESEYEDFSELEEIADENKKVHFYKSKSLINICADKKPLSMQKSKSFTSIDDIILIKKEDLNKILKDFYENISKIQVKQTNLSKENDALSEKTCEDNEENRHKILEIAAEEFIKDANKCNNKTKNVLVDSEDNIVPKKRRRYVETDADLTYPHLKCNITKIQTRKMRETFENSEVEKENLISDNGEKSYTTPKKNTDVLYLNTDFLEHFASNKSDYMSGTEVGESATDIPDGKWIDEYGLENGVKITEIFDSDENIQGDLGKTNKPIENNVAENYSDENAVKNCVKNFHLPNLVIKNKSDINCQKPVRYESQIKLPIIGSKRNCVQNFECEDDGEHSEIYCPSTSNTHFLEKKNCKTPISTISNNEPSLDEFVIALEDPSYFKSTPLNYYMEEYKSINSPVKEIKSDCLPLKEENLLTKVPIDILDLDSTKGFELLESIVNENTNKNFIIDSLNNQIFIKTNGTDDDLHKRKYSDEMSPIDPRLINKIDNLIVPSNLNDLSPTSTIDSGKTVRSVSVERNKIDKTPKLKRNGSITVRNLKKDFANNVQNQKAKPAVSSLIKPKVVSRQNSTETRSVKAVPSKIKSTIPTLSKDGQKNNEKKKSAEVDNCNINELNAEELFPEDNKMYEEYKKYEEMYLEERQKKSASRKHVPKPVDFGINLETFDGNTSAKPGYDSAYGSLKIAPKELENLSNLAQPKFCHECGTKYPVPSARFCIECGVKRLIL